MSFRIYESHPKAVVKDVNGSNIVDGANVSYTSTGNMVIMHIKQHTITKDSGVSSYTFVQVPYDFLPSESKFQFVGQYNNNIFIGDFNDGTFVLNFNVNKADTSFTSATIKDQTVSWTLNDGPNVGG